ncbi:hypothetical protein JCM17960_24540 [Magnetospira thiophila]
MPSSSAQGKQYSALIIAALHQAGAITRILDVGVGCGTYAELLRPYTPGAHWTGLEVWAPYVEKYHLRHLYDALVLADARSVDLQSLGSFDLIVFGDVLEHMEKQEAQALIDRSLAVGRLVLISIPIVRYKQGPIEDNPFERHIKDDWSHPEILSSFPALRCAFVQGAIGVYLLSRDETLVPRIEILHENVAARLQSLTPDVPLQWSRLRSDEKGPGSEKPGP